MLILDSPPPVRVAAEKGFEEMGNTLAEFIEACNRAELDAETFVDFNGRRFRAPFRCLCCGKEIRLSQFCYGRLCGSCDAGACHRWNRCFDPRAAHAPLERDWYLEISEPSPVEVDAIASMAS